MTSALKENEDAVDVESYVQGTLHPEVALTELGFTKRGEDDNRIFWLRRLGRGFWESVVIVKATGEVCYRKVKMHGRGLGSEFTVHDYDTKATMNDIRRKVLKWKHEDAQEVIHCLLDSDPDAFDPRAELDRILPGKCPECGSHNISNEADDEGLLDCMNCGIWWNPLHPANAPNVPGNYPDPDEHARQHPIIDYPIDAQGNRRPPGWTPPQQENIEDEDDPQEFIKRLAVPQPRICTSFSQTTPESSADGESSDHGWIDEEGVEMTPDDIDAEDGLTTVDLAVKFLSNEGAIHASSSHFHPGVWYSTDYHTIDYGTGTDEERCFHLKDFAEAEEQAIWDKLQLLWRQR